MERWRQHGARVQKSRCECVSVAPEEPTFNRVSRDNNFHAPVRQERVWDRSSSRGLAFGPCAGRLLGVSDTIPNITIPADLLPADGRFGSGPSKVRTQAVQALAATGTSFTA